MSIVEVNSRQARGKPEEGAARYAVYSYDAATSEGLAYTRSFIVVKNQYDVIIRFTRFQDFAGVYERGTVFPISSDPKKKLHSICMMLNYVLIDHGADYGVRHVFGITKPMLTDFFENYAVTEKEDGSHRQKETVERCISSVTRFMAGLCRKYGGYMSITRDELYREEAVVDRRGGRRIQLVPDFHIRNIPEVRETFRDLPTRAFELLLPLAFRYAPDIAFVMCLQAFAGLRAGEALNVRREDSLLGPGIVFTRVGDAVRSVEIDLRGVYVLRSDKLDVGRIKKPRRQRVYPPFIGAFCAAYELHMRFLSGRSYEMEYGPLFINNRGMALNYDSYRKKFSDLVDRHFRPALLSSPDPELRIYGQLLCEHHLTPHSLRHWFTVQLVLRGENIAGIQYWRGDKNPQSAFEYLQNKGDLVKELRAADEHLAGILMTAGREIYARG